MTDHHEPPRDASRPTDGRLARYRTVSGRAIAFGAGLGAGALGLLLVVATAPAGPPPLTQQDVDARVERALASQVPGPAFSQLVYEAILPSLTLVETGRASTAGLPVDAPAQGIGTAVVVTAGGDALTALHVVEGSTSIELTFADGSTSSASIIASQPEHDIAVLRPDTPPAAVVPATLGNPDRLRVGSEAYVVGHPFGLTGSMSSGVISGLERTFRVPERDQVFEGLIQIDAAVNPGNSGGPLLDRAGHVTGIVTALLNPNEDESFIGIGLAVPIDVAGGAAGLPPY